MSSPTTDAADDAAYHRSVRNTVIVLAVVVIVLGASIALTYVFDVTPSTFQTRTSVVSTYALTLTLQVNTTSAAANQGVEISAWLNGTSSGNVTAHSDWIFDKTKLASPPCESGFPVAVGLMLGHYTTDNFSLGTLAPFVQPKMVCLYQPSPAWFYFGSTSSRAIVNVGKLEVWVLSANATVSAAALGVPKLNPGVYTAVGADEWGDFVLTNFRLS